MSSLIILYHYDYIEDDSSASVTYGYDNNTNRLNTITTESTTYSFVYDVFGNTDEIKIGTTRTLSSYEYNSNNGKLETLTYGNGHEIKYIYDVLDRISEVQYNTGTNGAFETAYSYTYDAGGRIYSVTDHTSNEVTLYKYDNAGKLIQSVLYDEDTYTNIYGSTIYYDEQSRVRMVFHSFDYASSSGVRDESTYYSYWYNDAGNLSQLTVSGDYAYGTIKPTYDNLGRTTQKIIDFNVNSSDAFYNKVTYLYKSSGYNQSALVSQYKSEIGVTGNESSFATTTYNYTYDVNGNITEIKNASNAIQNKYYYDNLGQLTREDNLAKNKTYTWTYDNSGNITAKRTYAFTTSSLGVCQNTQNYLYNNSTWGDLLTEVGGKQIIYDEIGNPITIGNTTSEGEYYTLSWTGRQLTQMTSVEYYYDEEYDDFFPYDYQNIYSYEYNSDGIRTYKGFEQDGTFSYHNYLLNGSQIISESVLSSDEENSFYILVYIYDEVGSPIGMKYRTSSYAAGVYDVFFFEKNLQGDIVAVYNSSGTKLVSYSYDAWGNCTTTYPQGYSAAAKASLNPFRYRGYYYDVETGWYYLQSRYYNPQWGRFINLDVFIGTGNGILSYNMFTYCNNNPIAYIDANGEFLIATIVGGIIGGFGGAISAAMSGDSITAGAVTGAVTGAAIGYICDAVAGSIVTGGVAAPIYLAGGAAACGLVAATGNFVNQVCNYEIDKKNAKQNGIDIGSFSDNVDVKSIVASGITATATSFICIGAGSVVNSAFSDIPMDDAFNVMGKGLGDSMIGGSANLLTVCIDWLVQKTIAD